MRPGGIVAFITSKYTLDKQNPEIKKYIAQRAELLGAVRLPNDAFLKNAGTETTMDILPLQKRDRLLDIEPNWVHLGLTQDARSPGDSIPVNSYFADNPEMVLGRMTLDERMFPHRMRLDTRPAPDGDSVYPFSGILICGSCGSRMTRATRRRGNNVYYYYYCPTTKKHGCGSEGMLSEKTLIREKYDVMPAVINTVPVTARLKT